MGGLQTRCKAHACTCSRKTGLQHSSTCLAVHMACTCLPCKHSAVCSASLHYLLLPASFCPASVEAAWEERRHGHFLCACKLFYLFSAFMGGGEGFQARAVHVLPLPAQKALSCCFWQAARAHGAAAAALAAVKAGAGRAAHSLRTLLRQRPCAAPGGCAACCYAHRACQPAFLHSCAGTRFTGASRHASICGEQERLKRWRRYLRRAP